MKHKKTKLLISLLLVVFVVTSGFRCRWISPSEQALLQPIEITWWGVTDNSEDFSEIIADYTAMHPNISINYRKLRLEEYETELLNALAEDRGPDIITLHNTWIDRHFSKLEPLPPKIKMAYQINQMSLGVKQETIIEVREESSISASQVRDTFVDVVADDVIRANKVYGLPLSVDTLVLFYNRDLLNNAGIPLPPTTWQQVQANVSKLTYQDRSGNLTQGGIALGQADNVERFSDIVSLIMMQNGAEMTDGRQVTFNKIPTAFANQEYNPGPEAVRFYTEFSDPGKEVYTWNGDMPNSLDAFAQGQVAMMLGYSYHIPLLEAKRQGKLRYDIAPAPQIENRTEVNFANYWVYSVSRKSKNIDAAWDFIQFMTVRGTEATKYLERTQKPTALRAQIQTQTENDRLKIFAEQLLTAKSWYHGDDPSAMENAFREMINGIHAGQSLQQATQLAAQKIQQTYD